MRSRPHYSVHLGVTSHVDTESGTETFVEARIGKDSMTEVEPGTSIFSGVLVFEETMIVDRMALKVRYIHNPKAKIKLTEETVEELCRTLSE